MDTETTVDTDTSLESTPVETEESSQETSVPAGAQHTEDQGQSNQDATTEESFFDPNTVPEELKPAYKQMQAAFTKKTQEIAARNKELAAVKEKADAYAKYERFVPILEEMLGQENKPQSPQSGVELAALEQDLKTKGYSDDAIEMMKLGAQFIMNQVNQSREQEKIQVQREQEFRVLNQKIEQAELVDPRLKDEALTYQTADGETVKFYELVGRIVQSDRNWTKDPVAATKKAIAYIDALTGKAKTEGKEELTNSAQSKAKKFPSLNTSPQAVSKNRIPKTMDEAFQQAKEELGI
jgi:hypothetical protein